MNGYKRCRIEVASMAFIGVMLVLGEHAFAADVDVEKTKLDLITDTAQKICNAVSIDGSTSSRQVKGEITAQLSGLASKLANVGVSSSGSLNTESYHNVLQKDLAEAISDNANCKLRVFDVLQSKLLSASDLRKVPLQDAQILAGTWAGSYQCGISAGQLNWEIAADEGQISVTEKNKRKIGLWLRQGGASYTGTWIPPKLHLLSTTGFNHYSIDLQLLAGGRQLKGNYVNHRDCNAVQLVKTSK